MGCGSVLGDLFYLADSLLDSPRPVDDGWRRGNHLPPVARPPSSVPQPGNENLLAQLYKMYGEGQIDEEVFSALKALAARGQLRPADLAVHRVRARRHPPNKKDLEVANALRGLRSRLAQLERTRETSAGVLSELEARLAELDQRMMDKEGAARQTIEQDEESARQRLAEKAELKSSSERLSAQAQALQADLARLDDLRMQLEAKRAELEALQARGQLAEI